MNATINPCKREGCCKPARARSLCVNHYKAWRSQMIKAGLATSAGTLAQTIENYLPGTREQVAERSGHLYDWAHKVISAMHKDRKVFISDYQPPRYLGDKWQPIFDMGSRRDAKLDPERKRMHARRRKTARERMLSGRQASSPFAALGI